ncbi:MAG TPA: hypothetical protein PK736_00525 [Bacteroidia bacterium]|nr:hypothetical protein [Bacteroidia bacterium]
MQIIEVTTKEQAQQFLQLPLQLYKNDKNWAQPLDKDIDEVFDKEKNKFFRHGICARWLLADNGKTIGRVAAFVNHKLAKKNDQPTGGMGFFECINDQKAANILFDTCAEWLKEQGMEAMDGPINFGERESWWGLIIDGFNPPQYKMNYNLPYYQTLFETYGFKDYFQQHCYAIEQLEDLPQKFYQRHAEISKIPEYSFRTLKMNEIEKYAEDFRSIYNQAWVQHGSGRDLEQKQVQGFFKKLKPIIDPDIMAFAYYKNDPVAFAICLPDINQLFRKLNGKFGLWQKIKFFVMLKMHVCTKMIGTVFGIIPAHQGKGLDAYIFVEMEKIVKRKKSYDEFEMQWVGDFNPRMLNIAKEFCPVRSRVLVTYRFLFDRTKEFVRHPVIRG